MRWILSTTQFYIVYLEWVQATELSRATENTPQTANPKAVESKGNPSSSVGCSHIRLYNIRRFCLYTAGLVLILRAESSRKCMTELGQVRVHACQLGRRRHRVLTTGYAIIYPVQSQLSQLNRSGNLQGIGIYFEFATLIVWLISVLVRSTRALLINEHLHSTYIIAIKNSVIHFWTSNFSC